MMDTTAVGAALTASFAAGIWNMTLLNQNTTLLFRLIR